MIQNRIKEFINSLKNINLKSESTKKLYKKMIFFIVPTILVIIMCHAINFLFTEISAPKSYFLGEKISFMDKEQIKKIIETKKEEMGSRDITLVFNNGTKEITKKYYLKNLLDLNVEDKIINDIFDKDFISYDFSLKLFIKNIFYKKEYNLNYSIDGNSIEEMKKEIVLHETSVKNAKIKVDEQNLKFVLEKEQIGFSYDFNKLEKDILSFINSEKKSNIIKIEKITNEPRIFESDIAPVIIYVNTLIENSPIRVLYKTKTYNVTKDNLLNWMDFNYAMIGDSFNEVEIKIKKNDIVEYLSHIAEENDKEPKNGEIIFEDESKTKIKTFIPIEKGTSLNIEDSYTKIQDAIFSNKNDVVLTIDEKIPENINSDVAKYGLIEEIGIGKSNFSGSSKSRIHNIEVGSSFLNGLLIKPGEEFSLIKVIGQVTPEKGYLEELVIKGDKTEKEYGGGLCQVGTTIFRAALNSGFQITERRNHSYRVSYYEPAGTDATIYYPSPDFKFINNTKNYVLILTELNGNELIYKIWGTRDNRKVKVSEPIIKNIVLAPGTKWIETLDLKPGEKKCIESSHNGADAEFSYYVELEDGTKIDTIFKSHYRPWQAVCLIGVEKLSEYSYGYGYGYGY